VIVCDIDHFALVNEELGHHFGDQLIRARRQRLVGIMRAGARSAAWAGDTFAVICESIEPDKAAVDALTARIVDAFGEPFAIGGQEVFLVASAGAAWADESEPSEELLARAHAALVGAKERERGSFVVALPAATRPTRPRPAGAAAGAARGSRHRSAAHRLPADRLARRPEAACARGAAALEHPGLGPVSPLEFIPVAEDTV